MLKSWVENPATGKTEPAFKSPISTLYRDPRETPAWQPGQGIVSPEERRARWALALPKHVRLPAGPLPHIIAIGGGKGGVGKSLLSANLSTKLAEMGVKVLLADLDIGCANLHTHFGIPAPERSLADFVVRGSRSFAELPIQTGVNGLQLVAGGREDDWNNKLAVGGSGFLNLWNALLRSKLDLGVDVLLLDLGAGTHQHTMDFFSLAHCGIVVVLPEPTSIENAYVFLKTALWRFMENVGHRAGASALAGDVKAAICGPDPKGAGRGYAERLRSLAPLHPLLVRHIFSALGERNIGIVVNQTRTQQDIDIGSSMEMICQKYFGFHARYLGNLNYEESVWKAVRKRRLLVHDAPESGLSVRFGELAQRVLSGIVY